MTNITRNVFCLVAATVAIGCATTSISDSYKKNLSRAYRAQNHGHFEAAEQYHRAAVKQMRETEGVDYRQLAVGLSNWASALNHTGRPEEAQLLLNESFMIMTSEDDSPDARYLSSMMSNLARSHELQGDLDDAERLYLRALEIARKVHNWHPGVDAWSYRGLANIYARRGDFDTADKYFHKARRLYREGPGLDGVHWRRIQAEYDTLRGTH